MRSIPPRPVLITSIALLLSVCDSVTSGAELQPAARPVPEVVDHYVDELIRLDGIATAEQIGDQNLIRRLTLDLAGRIPTTAEVRAFLDSESETKRVELVDRLLASPDFALHLRNELELMLLPNRPNDGDFRKYLLWATEQNRPWDTMYRDMLVGDEEDEYQKAAMQFVRTRAKSIDDLTNDTSSLFFGVNVSCAKCHDHPLVEDWKQDHFYGMQSFFSRTYLTKKQRLGEKFFGDVKFKTTKGVEKQAKFMFLTGSVVDEPESKLSDDDRKKHDQEVKNQQKNDKAGPPPKPEFSPRQQLVEVSLREKDNSFFARNIANRVWHRIFGHGIVHPVDQMHSGNPPSHPELLDWLARDLVAHKYDLKRLIRGMVLSRTYSRSSRWQAESAPPQETYFAVAIPRVLTPRQYGMSLLIASRKPDYWKPLEAEAWKKQRNDLENQANGWAGRFEIPRDGFQIAVDEALLFSNSQQIENDLLNPGGDRLIGHLKTIEDAAASVDAAFQAICSRAPDDEERAAITRYLESRADNRDEAMRQVVWALLTGPEIRFNY